MTELNRREFFRRATVLSASSFAVPFGWAAAPFGRATAAPGDRRANMRLGFVTYLWGKDMDLPTLVDACERSGVLGVELRTEHKHGVEPSLSKAERKDVRKRFDDSPVILVGYGSNAQFHETDSAKVRKNIELTKAYIDLMHDCGGTGVKVKPNGLARGVPKEKTIEQIGAALNEVAQYGADFGQQIRLEVHGRETSELPIIRAIMDVADHRNATVCWNCNDADLHGDGLESNFNLVKDRFGDTVHVRELNRGTYPYARLIELYLSIDYSGWLLLEARTKPSDPVAAMIEQKKVFDRMTGQS